MEIVRQWRLKVTRLRNDDCEWAFETGGHVLDLLVEAALCTAHLVHTDNQKIKALSRLGDDGVAGLVLTCLCRNIDITAAVFVDLSDGLCSVLDDGLVACAFTALLLLALGASADVENGNGQSARAGQQSG